MKATCVLLRSGASDHVRAVSSYLVSDSIEHWPTVPEWKWVWRAWMNFVKILIVILTTAWIRMEFDWEDGRITLMVGWWGPSTSESVTGYGSREQWAAVGTGRCGRGWNLLNKELGARPGPGLYWGQDGHGIGRCRVGRRLCNKTLLFSGVLQLVFLCLPFSSYELVFCWSKKGLICKHFLPKLYTWLDRK